MKLIKYFIAQKPISDDLIEEQPIDLRPITRPCTDENFERYLEISKDQAYNGEVTVEEVPDPPMTEEKARAKRDRLLAETDWTQVLDAPIDEETKTAYRAYRQALRDVPQQEGFPETITWPELPEKVKADPEPVDEAVDLLLSGATGEEAAG